MRTHKPSDTQLGALAKEIRQDQRKSAPAEKRVRVRTGFKEAIKKMSKTAPPRQ